MQELSSSVGYHPHQKIAFLVPLLTTDHILGKKGNSYSFYQNFCLRFQLHNYDFISKSSMELILFIQNSAQQGYLSDIYPRYLPCQNVSAFDVALLCGRCNRFISSAIKSVIPSLSSTNFYAITLCKLHL